MDYRGNRADVRVSHYSSVDGLSYGELQPELGRQQTSLRVGTAIAFANSKIAIGAPVKGDAFAIVYPHESIAGKEIRIGDEENLRAVADGLGPALVTDVPAYRPGTIPIDVDDLPLGYSLGASAFDTLAPYRAGYDLQVGSSFSVSVYGTLLDATGAPVALLAGTAHAESNPGRQVQVFTNAAGKFGAEGLAEGRWIIEMPADTGVIRYVIDVPGSTTGLVKVGELTAIARSNTGSNIVRNIRTDCALAAIAALLAATGCRAGPCVIDRGHSIHNRDPSAALGNLLASGAGHGHCSDT